MFSTFRFWWQLRRLFAEQDRVRQIYAEHRAKARAANAPLEVANLNAEARDQEDIAADEIDILVTQYWLRRAKRLFVTTPEREEPGMWRESYILQRWVLTEKGISSVRAAVREEWKSKREFLAFIGSGIIGLIGAITGLVAVLKD